MCLVTHLTREGDDWGVGVCGVIQAIGAATRVRTTVSTRVRTRIVDFPSFELDFQAIHTLE
jgi:hypothetical protein